MSRRKQQNPKPVLKGDQFCATVDNPAPVGTHQNLQEDFEEVDSPGFPSLVIKSDDHKSNKDKSFHNKSTSGEPQTVVNSQHLNSISENNQNLYRDNLSQNKITNSQFSKVLDHLQKQQASRQQQQMLQLQSDDNNSISSENSQSSSSVPSSELINSPYATSMTRMDETALSNGHFPNPSEGSTSPLHGSRPPKQIAPNKTRRKSDKIIPITDESGKSKYICPVCKQGFANDSELTKHIRMHNSASAINTCKICGKVLSSQSSLDRHMLVHSGERPFKCKVCKMAFTTNGNMHRHSRIHDKEGGSVNAQNERHKLNDQGSSQQFSIPLTLRGRFKRKSSTESENESLERPPKRFFFGSSDHALMDRENVELRTPLKTVKNKTKQNEKDTGDENCEPIQCPICLKPFMCTYGLDGHFEIHTSSDSSLCQLCHTSFNNSRDVYIHYLSTHIDLKRIDGEYQIKSQKENVSSPSQESLVGFDELGSLSDFSSKQFPHIAKAWCEKNQREPSSPFHNYSCEKCQHAFPCAEALINHLQNHPDECNVNCNSCDVNFVNREQFEDHVLQHSKSNVINTFSSKIGTDDNDVQDMVSQPEFMLVLGLKSRKSRFSTKDTNIIADVKKAIEDNCGPVGTKVSPAVQREIKPMVIQPIETEVKKTHILPTVRIPSYQPLRPDNPILPPQMHPAFSPQLRRYQNPVKSGLPSQVNDWNCGTSEGDPVEIASSSEDENEIDNTTERPWQCVICEFAFQTKPQSLKHCRKYHGLYTNEELNSAVSHNPFSRIVPNAKPPAWSLKPFLCKLCKNGFSNKMNCMKHLIQQHGVEPRLAERHLALNKLLQDKTQNYPPGILETVKRIQEVAMHQRNMTLSQHHVNPVVNNHNLPSPVLTSPFSKANHGTYITSPPITHQMFKKEPIDTEVDEKPLDFSMKKNGNAESQSRRQQITDGFKNLNEKSSGEEPMDLTIKPLKEGHSSSESSRSGYNSSTDLSANRGVVMPSPHLNIQNHIQTSHLKGQSLLFCNQCPAQFATQEALDRHLVSKHPQSEKNLRKSAPRNKVDLPHNNKHVATCFENRRPGSPANRDTSSPKDNNSDSELASVSSMLYATSSQNFKDFLSHSNMASGKHKLNHDEIKQPLSVDIDEEESLQGSDKSNSPQKEKKVKRNSYSDSPHKLQCPYCPRAFPWISSLKRHILTHTGQKPFKCPECSVTFSTKSNRERHMVRKHGMNIHDPATRQAMEKPYSCHICTENFASASSIQKHYKDDHTELDIPEFINQQAKFESLPAVILQDKLDLSQIDAFSTTSGDPSEGVDASLIDFEDEDEDEGSVTSLSSSISPSKHIPTTTTLASVSPVPLHPQPITIKPLDVPMSSASTVPDTASKAVPEYLNKINPERDNYNVDKITKCWKCNANFDSRKILLRHLKEHNIDNSYKCYLCDASYNLRSECLEHTMKQHPHDWVMLREKNKCYNIGEYSENMEKLVTETIENLGLTEVNSAILAGADIDRNGVMKGPDGEEKEGIDKPDSDYAQRKVFCSFCVKRFWSLQDLRRHMRSHTGERPFECDVCQKRFTLKHSMMRHRRKHTPAELAEAASPVLSASDEDTNDGGHTNVNPVHSNLRVALFTKRKPESNRSTPVIPVENDAESVSPVPSTVDEPFVEEEEKDGSDMLHNLLGIDSSKIDELFASKNIINSATEVLGMDHGKDGN